MDGVQCPSGIDVSWTHHQGDKAHSKVLSPRNKAPPPSSASVPIPDSTTPLPPPSLQPSENATAVSPPQLSQQPLTPQSTLPKSSPSSALAANEHTVPTPNSASSSTAAAATAAAAAPLSSVPQTIPPSKRSSLARSRPSAEKLSQSPETPSKRPGWISSLSSKFGSSSQTNVHANGHNHTQPHVGGHTPHPPSSSHLAQQAANPSPAESSEEMKPYVPQQPKSGNFFSNTLRRLSTSGGSGPNVKVPASGGVCPRQTLNVDRGRERCELKALRPSKLKRVAFSVDVEIAGCAQYGDEDGPLDKADKKRDIKMKDQSEGAALKNPQKVAEEKDKLGILSATSEQLTQTSSLEGEGQTPVDSLDEQQQALWLAEEAARAERAERRRMAGAVPMETSMDDSDNDATAPELKVQDKPTTDPVRMYRRCCQLREAPVLKRITEQLMNPQRSCLEKDGTVGCLDLRGSRMQLQDVICVGDWLSIVPVRKLLLDNANLSDEGLRHILAGLLAIKPAGLVQRKRGRSKPNHPRQTVINRSPGVIEKLTLKNNPKIGADGWKYIFIFLNMSKSIRAIDLSMISFAVSQETGEATDRAGERSRSRRSTCTMDMAELFFQALSTRVGGSQLKELTMSNCNLTSRDVGKIVDAALVCKISTLGFAQNKLDSAGFQHIFRYIRSNLCMALDVGSNDIRPLAMALAETIEACDKQCPLWGLSLAECNIDPYTLAKLLPAFARLPNVRFLDLSHNRDLFGGEENGNPTALGTLRKCLPLLPRLRRLHLNDVALAPSHAIALAEIFPEIRNINHIAVMENPLIKVLADTEDISQQEDACALYASLMIAVRVSKTLLAIEIESPGPSNSDVVRAIHKQMTAYALRNLERFTSYDVVTVDDPAAVLPDLLPEDEQALLPQVLVHLVGQNENPNADHEHDDELGPDHDYLVGGTGVVKALSYCLGQRMNDMKRLSTSGAVTPVTPVSPARRQWEEKAEDKAEEKVQAKELSRTLLESARKIRKRLQAAIERDKGSNDDFYLRRLQFLDHTLQGIIERFEQEYPECRATAGLMTDLPPQHLPQPAVPHAEPVEADPSPSLSRGSSINSVSNRASSATTGPGLDDDDGDFMYSARSSRRGSEASVHSRKMGLEEGQMLRFGQRVRRELLPPRGQTDHLHGTSASDAPEEEHLAMLRSQLEKLAGDELRNHVVTEGLDAAVREYSGRAKQYKRMSLSRPGTSERDQALE